MALQPSRPFNLPGITRDNAISRPVDPGLIARISGSMRQWLGMQTGPGSPELPFFPPGRPLDPLAQGAAGRRFDYATSYNTITTPRAYEAINFETLRAIADPTVGGYDLVRLAVETRKDQCAKLVHSILPKKNSSETVRAKADDRCEKIEQILLRPDGETPWQQWCSQLIEEHLVIDAPAILRKKNMGGETIGIELIDGATIKPLLNYDGRRPTTGAAYQQILKGIPAVDYTRDDLLYAPRNPRVHKVYGMSCVEQVIVTVNIGLRRQAGQLGFYTEGNIPDALASVPASWSTAQIREFQDYWDTMVNDAVTRRKMRFIPDGTKFQQTRDPGALVDAFDEWLARVIAYCFSLPPTPFVKMQNRATAESAYEEALSEGLQPLMVWMKGIIDYICANWFGCPDLELVWDDIKKTDPAEKEERDLVLVEKGIISADDMRAERGIEPLGLPPIVYGIGPLGFMSVAAIQKAIANGWDLTGMPQVPAPGAGGEMGGMPGAAGAPAADGSDTLDGLPPEVLEALGLDAGDQGDSADAPAGPMPQRETMSGNSRPSVPVNGNGGASNVVPLHRHPGVTAALQHGDRMARQMAAKMAAGGKR